MEEAAGKQVPPRHQQARHRLQQSRKPHDLEDYLITPFPALPAGRCCDWGIEALQRAGREGSGHARQREKGKRVGTFQAVGG